MSLKNREPGTKGFTEEDLVSRVREGDQKAEVLIFNRFGARIDAIVRNRIGYHNEDWQDVSSVIKTAVLISIREGRYESDKGTLPTWVLKITRNQIAKYLRDREKKPHFVDIEEVPESIKATTDRLNLEREELFKIIKKILKELPEKYKKVIELKYLEGRSPPEISTQLNIPVVRVYEYSHYGVTLVKKKCIEKGIFQDFFD